MLKHIASICIISVLAITVACSSGQSSGGSTSSGGSGSSGGAKSRSADVGGDPNMALQALNKSLSEVPSYSPGGKGFAYKMSNVTPADFQAWAGKHKESFQKVLDQIPAGYVLQVTGHTDNVGPRDADTSTGRKGNIFYSTERAKAVHGALVNAGLPAAKMTYKGIADDELLSEFPADDQRQRRVTYKIVPAPAK